MADQLISERVMAIVGNTLLVYQAIEHAMKDVARFVDISVPVTLNLAESRARAEKIVGKRAKLIGASTMGGMVMKEYLKLFEPLTFSEADDSATEISFRLKFEFTTDEVERNAWAKEIEQLIAERNWVVHQSLLELRAETEAMRDAAFNKLEAYNAHAHKVLGFVERHAGVTACARQVTAKSFSLIASKLMATSLKITGVMCDRKRMKPDKDGWVPVQRLQARCDEEFGEELKEACEVTQAKSVIEFLKKQMGGMEIEEQKTKNGMRMMYRIPEATTPKNATSR